MADQLGSLEYLIMLAVIRLGDNAYGRTIQEELLARTDKEFAIGSIYNTLRRMSDKGFVEYSCGEPRPERGGRAIRFVRITALGQTARAHREEDVKRLSEGLTIRGGMQYEY